MKERRRNEQDLDKLKRIFLRLRRNPGYQLNDAAYIETISKEIRRMADNGRAKMLLLNPIK
jgi:hypothetical protein